MTQNRKIALAAAAAALFFGACNDTFDPLSTKAPARLEYVANLSPASEVPAVTASSSGSSSITILDTNLIRVTVNVAAIDSVTQSHIHAGDAATAGPVMVFLFGPVTAATFPNGVGTGTTTTLNGVLRVLDIQKGVTNFTGVYTFDSLMTRIKNGTSYVNVHTRKNGGGEIRGQIVPK